MPAARAAASAVAGAAATAAHASHAVPSHAARIGMYRQLLRTASLFHDYNFRSYAQRRVKEKFHEHQHVKEPAQLRSLYEQAHKDLKMMRRQTLINQLYSTGHNILEKAPQHEHHLTSAFNLRVAPAPTESFREWLAETAVAEPPTDNPADHTLAPSKAAKREPGQSTRLNTDSKGQHTTKNLEEGYSS